MSFQNGEASALSADVQPLFLLADSDFVYWASVDTNGRSRLMRAPAKAGQTGGEVTLIAMDQSVSDLAQDACNLYWTDSSQGQVLSVGKQ
jgi:hypothetical protein